jgi:hypothetical protein
VDGRRARFPFEHPALVALRCAVLLALFGMEERQLG